MAKSELWLEIGSYTSRDVDLNWKLVEGKEIIDEYIIDVSNITEDGQNSFSGLNSSFVRFKIPSLKVGCSYKVRIKGVQIESIPLKSGGSVTKIKRIVESNVVHFDAVYNIREMSRLVVLAMDYVSSKSNTCGYIPCDYVYRNKPKSYFDDIRNNRGGIMEPYIKDNNGDPASPINNRIKGLFFATFVDKKTGFPPLTSPFGDTRLYIPSHRFFNRDNNLYFADFYCNKSHWMTLVVTQIGSIADEICSSVLVRLNINENFFLYWDEICNNLMVTSAVFVEIMYAEDLDLNEETDYGAFFRKIASSNKGSSYNHVVKSTHCNDCNVYPNENILIECI